MDIKITNNLNFFLAVLNLMLCIINIGSAIIIGLSGLMMFAIAFTAFAAIGCGYSSIEFKKAEE